MNPSSCIPPIPPGYVFVTAGLRITKVIPPETKFLSLDKTQWLDVHSSWNGWPFTKFSPDINFIAKL